MNYKFISKVRVIPGPEKEKEEDAYFVSKNIIAVADGVSSWKFHKVNPGTFARELIYNIKKEAKKEKEITKLLENAYENTKEEGSSTICLLMLNGDVLESLNLGDSGFMVIRNYKVIFKSKEQRHEINFPFQIGRDNSGNILNDLPKDAVYKKMKIEENDIIIVGSDGLFDNLEEGYILDETKKGKRYLATRLAGKAYEFGSKPDDITVIAAEVLISEN